MKKINKLIILILMILSISLVAVTKVNAQSIQAFDDNIMDVYEPLTATFQTNNYTASGSFPFAKYQYARVGQSSYSNITSASGNAILGQYFTGNTSPFVYSVAFLNNNLGNDSDSLTDYTTLTINGTEIISENQLVTNNYNVYSGSNRKLNIGTLLNNDNYYGLIVHCLMTTDKEPGSTPAIYTIHDIWTIITFIEFVDNEFVYTTYTDRWYQWSEQGIVISLSKLSNSNGDIVSNGDYLQIYPLVYETSSNKLIERKPSEVVNVWNSYSNSIVKYLNSVASIPNAESIAKLDTAEKYYETGYYAGRVLGYDEGYSVGLNEGSNITTNWIATISKAVGSVLALEILPNFPLGLIVAIPLVLGLIGLILYFWRKE